FKSFGVKEATGIAVTFSIYFADNNLYIAGALDNIGAYLFSDLFIHNSVCNDNGLNKSNYLIGKIDLNGNFKWVETFCAGNHNLGYAICVDGQNIYTGGYYQGKVFSLGNLNGTFSNPDDGINNIFFGKLKDQYVKVGVVSPTQLIPGCTV